MVRKMSKPDWYNCWANMKQRCLNENHPRFHLYGGRGIGVDERWLKSSNFYEDMGDRPSRHHSIERVDNSRGYSKDNCIWATQTVQCQNRRVRKDNKLGERGVYSNKFGTFYVRLFNNRKAYMSGPIYSLEDAVELRDFALEEIKLG